MFLFLYPYVLICMYILQLLPSTCEPPSRPRNSQAFYMPKMTQRRGGRENPKANNSEAS